MSLLADFPGDDDAPAGAVIGLDPAASSRRSIWTDEDIRRMHRPNPPDPPNDPFPRRAPNPWLDDPPPSAESLFWTYMAFLGPPARRIGVGEELRGLIREGRYADAFVLALWVDRIHPPPERPPMPPLVPSKPYGTPIPGTDEVDDQPPDWVKTGLPRRRDWRAEAEG